MLNDLRWKPKLVALVGKLSGQFNTNTKTANTVLNGTEMREIEQVLLCEK